MYLKTFCLSLALAGRRHEVKGMPTITLSALQVINNLEGGRDMVNLSRKSERGTEMDQNGKTWSASPSSFF